MYDKNGRLTLEGAKQVIDSGGSVSIGGQLHTTVATLPSAVELSTMNAVTREQAEKAIKVGGSFTYKDKKYTEIDKLPSADEFEADNLKARHEAREQLQKEIDDRQRQLDEADKLTDQATKLHTQAAQTRAAARGQRTDTAATSTEDLNELTVADLHERAKAAGVEGYSTMHKDELVKAVRKAEKK